jgi:hypothetical protein
VLGRAKARLIARLYYARQIDRFREGCFVLVLVLVLERLVWSVANYRPGDEADKSDT